MNAGVTYYSAAVAARNELDIIRFPASVNLSDKILNAASVPGTAKNPVAALVLSGSCSPRKARKSCKRPASRR